MRFEYQNLRDMEKHYVKSKEALTLFGTLMWERKEKVILFSIAVNRKFAFTPSGIWCYMIVGLTWKFYI